ncbi:AAA family ATPase [Zavarzinia sp. CC-PAN008]|uniref:AAA family ATPase n=1 Tax=Zavarzinia sp. CC-PAN008 TaxID=3243332 RepID=UPI003F74AC2F
MRILRIGGENLASLAAPFTIDLEAEPLAGTGLFAITGETGAGKSTILDALCLALFGQYPRVDVGRQEDVPDPSGTVISAKDPRAILRRGAGAGRAEVDFVAQDGRTYRAIWRVRRARDRADGRLQFDERELRCLSTGSAIGGTRTQIGEEVERLTGLTFDQFRRTVLLAQGEFDTFLMARENERAELLEKITGTGVYARISTLVHGQAEQRRRALDDLVRQREAIGVLEYEARAVLEAELAAAAQAVANQDAERAALAARRAQLARLAEAEHLQTAAGEAVAAAQVAFDAGAATRDRLATLTAVEALRGPAQAAQDARRTAQNLAAAAGEALARLAQATADNAAAGAALTERQTARAAATAAVAEAQPLWAEADRLDVELRAAEHELAQAAQQAVAAADLAAQHTRADATAARELAEALAAHEAACARLDARAGHETLAAREDDLATRIAKHQDLSAALARGRDQARAKANALALATAQAGEDATRRATHVAEHDRLTQAITEVQASLDGLDAPALARREAGLRDVLGPLDQACRLAADRRQAMADERRAEGDAQAAASARADAAGHLSRLTDQAQALRTARGALLPMVDLAEQAVSEQALHLRAVLVHGQPCPVCGAAEHPVATQPDSLGRLAETIRQQRQALDCDLARLEAELLEAAQGEAAAAGRHANATAAGAQAAARRQAAAASYGTLHPALCTALAVAGLAPSPSAGLADAADLLEHHAAAAHSARQALKPLLDQAADLERADRDLRRQLDLVRVTLDGLDSAAQTRAGQIQALQLEATRLATQEDDLAERLTSLARELEPSLRQAGLDPADLEARPALAIRTVRDLAQAWRTARAEVVRLDQALATLRPRAAAAAQALVAAQAQATATAARAAERQAARDGLRDARAGLLAGEATAPHRSRLTQAVQTAEQALDAARATAQDAATALSAAAGRAGDTTHAASHAAALADTADAALDQACRAQGWDAAQARALLAVPVAERDRLRAQADALDRALAQARVLHGQRQDDVAQLRRDLAPGLDDAALTTALAAIEQAVTGLRETVGRIKAQLEADDALRDRVRDLDQQLATERAAYAPWGTVNEAIGAPTGDRFRRFVQGITLEHLVQLANIQLDALNPRYRLLRAAGAELGLHVVDRDMGDQVRATRSLSGGERFLVSLALALALSGLEGRSAFVDTLFIDEGFGALDAETLEVAITALEALQGGGRRVGVITHVAAMIERIAVQIRVERRGGGRSVIRTDAPPPG